MDAFFFQKISQTSIEIFSAIISFENTDFNLELGFNESIKILENLCNIKFGFHLMNATKSSMIINESHKPSFSIQDIDFRRSPYVTIDHVKIT